MNKPIPMCDPLGFQTEGNDYLRGQIQDRDQTTYAVNGGDAIRLSQPMMETTGLERWPRDDDNIRCGEEGE